MASYFIGIDVGTGSARAGIFDRRGVMVSKAKRDIALFQDGPDTAEQSSNDIWRAVCESVREALSHTDLTADDIAGLGFDATCSLVVVGPEGTPLPVGTSGDDERNIIVWMDHRALEQAHRINQTAHSVLTYVGGTISPEMETPKLLWLKENLSATYAAAWQFFDLADFLTWRATGDLARSVCTVTCKWTYLAHEGRWDEGYFRQIGLDDIASDGFARIGTRIVDPGHPVGEGLSVSAARELGLNPGTPVAAGLIDAHAGGIGSVGGSSDQGSSITRLAYVFGTSACTMMSSQKPHFIPGIWGPYYSAMVPGLWLSEGGQSAAGAAIDYLTSMHPASHEAGAKAAAVGLSLPEWLADEAAQASPSLSEVACLANQLHVVPDFLGNRAPMANPHARGLIAGLGMERDLQSLVSLYVAGLLSLGYGLRQIVAASRERGATIEAIALSGGAGRHAVVRQLIADSTGIPVLVSREEDPVLLGSAMLAAAASKAFGTLQAAIANMSAVGDRYEPASGHIADLHEQRFRAFETLQKTALSLLQQP
jgi:D-ribulokinase